MKTLLIVSAVMLAGSANAVMLTSQQVEEPNYGASIKDLEKRVSELEKELACYWAWRAGANVPLCETDPSINPRPFGDEPDEQPMKIEYKGMKIYCSDCDEKGICFYRACK